MFFNTSTYHFYFNLTILTPKLSYLKLTNWPLGIQIHLTVNMAKSRTQQKHRYALEARLARMSTRKSFRLAPHRLNTWLMLHTNPAVMVETEDSEGLLNMKVWN